MRLFDILYNKFYPPTVFNRRKAMRRNRNVSFSLFCGNCMGGYIYHQLGLEFKSPTINTMILQPDLFRLVSDLKNYENLEFEEIENSGDVPTGKLGDVIVYFTHYNSFQEGVYNWYKRSKRINYDNICVIASDRDGMTVDDIAAWQNVPCKKVIFTAKKYDYPYCFWLPEFEKHGTIGNILKKTLSGKWYFEKIFDYVGWLNSTDPIAEHFRI